jgi:acyl-coenzyme A thioesterase PaaI-like protein
VTHPNWPYDVLGVLITRRCAGSGSAEAELVTDDRHVDTHGVVRRQSLLAVVDAALDAICNEPIGATVNTLIIQYLGTAHAGDVLRATATVAARQVDLEVVEVRLIRDGDGRLVGYASARITHEND